MIDVSPEALRKMLAGNPHLGISCSFGIDEEFLLDSLAITWLVYQIDELFGVRVDYEDPRISGPTSVRQIASYLNDWGKSARNVR